MNNNPKECFKAKTIFNSISSHPSSHFFATGCKEVWLWDLNTFKPIQKLFWGKASISKVHFNPFEYNILTSCSCDGSVLLFDFRLRSPVSKILMNMPSNDISWSYTNPWEFVLANEDSNVYSFDLRNIGKISKIYKGHVMPVLCIDQNPKYGNIVTGSYDNTIRLFENNKPLNTQVYFTQRMRRVLDICFSLDGKYIISASEDGNLRLWKTFDDKTSFFDNCFRSKENENKKILSNFKKSNIIYNPRVISTQIKNMLYIKNKLLKNKKKKNNRNNIYILPGYINFKSKKINL
jgi:WD repeat and SOF domain-containing protein 1